VTPCSVAAGYHHFGSPTWRIFTIVKTSHEGLCSNGVGRNLLQQLNGSVLVWQTHCTWSCSVSSSGFILISYFTHTDVIFVNSTSYWLCTSKWIISGFVCSFIELLRIVKCSGAFPSTWLLDRISRTNIPLQPWTWQLYLKTSFHLGHDPPPL